MKIKQIKVPDIHHLAKYPDVKYTTKLILKQNNFLYPNKITFGDITYFFTEDYEEVGHIFLPTMTGILFIPYRKWDKTHLIHHRIYNAHTGNMLQEGIPS